MQMHMYVQGGVKVKIEYFGYFCEVVESQGISLAAQKMYISQQGLSKALNVIESELGTTLLNRNRNSGSVSLTAEAGVTLVSGIVAIEIDLQLADTPLEHLGRI